MLIMSLQRPPRLLQFLYLMTLLATDAAGFEQEPPASSGGFGGGLPNGAQNTPMPFTGSGAKKHHNANTNKMRKYTYSTPPPNHCPQIYRCYKNNRLLFPVNQCSMALTQFRCIAKTTAMCRQHMGVRPMTINPLTQSLKYCRIACRNTSAKCTVRSYFTGGSNRNATGTDGNEWPLGNRRNGTTSQAQKHLEQERQRKEKIKKEKQEALRRQKEIAEKARNEQKQKEQQREREQRERQQKEIERKAREQREREQKEREQREMERKAREQREREQKEREQREMERKAREQKEREQKEREQREMERKAREQKEMAEKARNEQKQKEQQRERQQKEIERKAREQKEREQKEQEQREMERKAREQKESEQKEREQREMERKAREQREMEQRKKEEREREQRKRAREWQRQQQEKREREQRQKEVRDKIRKTKEQMKQTRRQEEQNKKKEENKSKNTHHGILTKERGYPNDVNTISSESNIETSLLGETGKNMIPSKVTSSMHHGDGKTVNKWDIHGNNSGGRVTVLTIFIYSVAPTITILLSSYF